MRIEEKKVIEEKERHIIEILEDVRIPLTDYILEKGDKIEIIPFEEEQEELIPFEDIKKKVEEQEEEEN